MAFSSFSQAQCRQAAHSLAWHLAWLPITPGARERSGGPQLWHQMEHERSNFTSQGGLL